MALEPLEMVCVKEEPREWGGSCGGSEAPAGRAGGADGVSRGLDLPTNDHVQIKVEVELVKKEAGERGVGGANASEGGVARGAGRARCTTPPPAVSNSPSTSSAGTQTAIKQTKRRKTGIKYHPRGTIHTCEVCEKTFRRLSKYKLHRRTHTREKPYKCEICKKQFTRLDSVRLHTRMHTGEYRYSCEICKKQFTGFSRYNVHKRIHTGEKPYSCDVCKKGFAQLGHLQSHTRVHTGEKLYTCGVCGKEFGQSGNLKAHMLTHSKEKPYLCEICKKEFSRLNNLKRHHKLLHTGEPQYSCGVRDSI